MNKNKKILFGITGIIILAGVFYGGMSYEKSLSANNNQNRAGQGQFGQFNRANRNGYGGSGNFLSGEVISKDNQSITIKLNNTSTETGSKIIFIDPNTTITKFTNGSLSDLSSGTQVMVNGSSNSDGSITAKTIQIRR